MEDSLTSPPDTGGLQDSAPSSTKAGNHQEKASRHNKNKKRRKDKGSKMEQDKVNEDEAINKVNSDTSIPSSEQNTPTRIEVSTIGITSKDESPPSSDGGSNHVATSLANKFWRLE
jgi:hypothetical protein